MAELKKCPFCKSENIYIIHDKISIKRKTFVECQYCKATAPIESWNRRATEAEIRNKAIDEFAERVKPIIDEKIKGWTNSDDLRRWCERAVDTVAEQLNGE